LLFAAIFAVTIFCSCCCCWGSASDIFLLIFSGYCRKGVLPFIFTTTHTFLQQKLLSHRKIPKIYLKHAAIRHSAISLLAFSFRLIAAPVTCGLSYPSPQFSPHLARFAPRFALPLLCVLYRCVLGLAKINCQLIQTYVSLFAPRTPNSPSISMVLSP